jgi:hypothetical protein
MVDVRLFVVYLVIGFTFAVFVCYVVWEPDLGSFFRFNKVEDDKEIVYQGIPSPTANRLYYEALLNKVNFCCRNYPNYKPFRHEKRCGARYFDDYDRFYWLWLYYFSSFKEVIDLLEDYKKDVDEGELGYYDDIQKKREKRICNTLYNFRRSADRFDYIYLFCMIGFPFGEAFIAAFHIIHFQFWGKKWRVEGDYSPILYPIFYSLYGILNAITLSFANIPIKFAYALLSLGFHSADSLSNIEKSILIIFYVVLVGVVFLLILLVLQEVDVDECGGESPNTLNVELPEWFHKLPEPDNTIIDPLSRIFDNSINSCDQLEPDVLMSDPTVDRDEIEEHELDKVVEAIPDNIEEIDV